MNNNNNRFRILEVLGRGAQGEVALAEDRARGGRRVALKRFENSDDARDRSRDEYQRVAPFHHPNLARALDYGDTDTGPSLSYEFVAGGPILDAADRPLEARLDLIAATLRAMAFLHAHGVVHGDVSPENVRLTEQGSVKLIDFGLSGEVGAPQHGGGTPRYMAPEMMHGAPLDPRADLFSLGAVAYELLGGVPAITIHEGGRVDHDGIPRLESRAANLPLDTADWVHSLLAIRPEDRPADARAALRGLDRVAPQRIEIETESTIRAYIDSAGLTRLEPELASVCAAFDEIGTQRSPLPPAMALVQGGLGVGKTRFLTAFARWAALRGARVVDVAAESTESAPFALLSKLLDRVDDLGVSEDPCGRTRETILDGSGADPGDAIRVMDQVTATLFHLADAQPLVLLIDDLHLADASSLAVIAYLARNLRLDPRDGRGRRAGLFLVTAWESTEEASAALAPISTEAPVDAPRVMIDAYKREQVGQMLASVLRTEPAPLSIDWAHQLTEGNPLFAVELLSALTEAFGVPESGLGLTLEIDPKAQAAVPETLAALIERRLGARSPDERDLLTLLAVLGRPTDLALIAAAWDHPRRHVAAHLRALADARFVAQPSDAPSCFGLRDRPTLEHLAASLTTDEAARWHARAGAAVSQCEPGNFAALARHFLIADPTGRGRRFAERAGEGAQGLGAFPEAIDEYRAALDATPIDCTDDQVRLRTKLAEVYLTTGRGSEAAALLEAGVSDVGGTPPTVMLRQLGDAHYLNADYAEAIACFRVCQRRLRADSPAARLPILARRAESAARRGRYSAALLLSKFMLRWNPIDRQDPTVREIQKDVHRRLSLVSFQRAQFEEAKRHAERSLNMVDGVPLEEAALLNIIGNICLRLGAADDARGHYERALTLREKHGDLKGMASCLNNIGLVWSRAGNRSAAADAFRRAIAIQAQVGDRAGQATALNNLAGAYIADAKIDRAIAVFEQSLDLAQQLGNHQVEAMIHTNLGSIAALRGVWGIALEHYVKSLRLRRALRTPARMEDTLVNLGALLLEIGDTRRAGRILNRVLTRATRNGHAVQVLDARVVRARLWDSEGRFDEAQEELSAILADAEGRGLRPQLIEAHLALAQHFLERGRFERSRSHLDAGLATMGAEDDHTPISERFLLTRLQLDKRAGSATPEEMLPALERLCERSHARGALPLVLDGLCLEALIRQSTAPAAALHAYQRAADTVERMASTISSTQLYEAFHRSPRVRRLEQAAQGFRQQAYLASEDPTVRGESSLRQLKANLYDVERTLDYSRSRFDKQNTGLKRILEIAHVMSATHQTTGLFELILDSIMELTEAERGFVIVRDADAETGVRVTAARDREKHDITDPEREISFSVVSRVLSEGQPMMLRDAAGDDIIDHSLSVLRLDLRSIMCVPLIFGSETTGVLYVENRTRTDQFAEEDLELLTIFAHQSAVALTNAELFRDLNRSLTELEEAQDLLVRQGKLSLMAEIASGVLHNLKNVLTPLLGTTQLLLADTTNDPIRSDLEAIERLSLECRELIQRFSNFSKGGARLVDVVPIALRDLIDEIVRDTRTHWDREGSGIEVRNDTPDAVRVHANASQLREVMINLIYNASDAMPGGGQIRITAHQDDEHVRIAVSDTGIGMTEEVLKQMFDPFFSTKKETGMGVGMSVTYTIIEQHGGAIEATSAPGEGTTIEIVLPSAPDRPTKATPALPASAKNRRSILIVDDDPDVLRFLEEVLSGHGYEVTSATDAAEARSIIADDHPNEGTWDLLLTDLQMPKGSGLEIAALAKKLAPQLPIIVMTAFPLEVPENSAHVDAVLGKPVTVQELTEAIERVTAPAAAGRG